MANDCIAKGSERHETDPKDFARRRLTITTASNTNKTTHKPVVA